VLICDGDTGRGAASPLAKRLSAIRNHGNKDTPGSIPTSRSGLSGREGDNLSVKQLAAEHIPLWHHPSSASLSLGSSGRESPMKKDHGKPSHLWGNWGRTEFNQYRLIT